MKINESVVEHISELARLDFGQEEKGLFSQQLNSILLYMEKLAELDTTDVPPTYHAISISNVLREDKVIPSYEREEILSNAPDKDRGCFKVPRIIE